MFRFSRAIAASTFNSFKSADISSRELVVCESVSHFSADTSARYSGRYGFLKGRGRERWVFIPCSSGVMLILRRRFAATLARVIGTGFMVFPEKNADIRQFLLFGTVFMVWAGWTSHKFSSRPFFFTPLKN